ncbi:MAG: hypothetical protein HS113_09390 [Verrucomicrobiales bacterium]|nr:hypothetical protein [Verrucomicrobiales bacterium]
MIANHPHAHLDRLNLEMDRRVAAKIRQDPSLVSIARANLQRWMERDEGFVHPVHGEWLDILRFLEPGELADFIESDTPKADRLRQSSPFTGILSEAERLAILHADEETTV